MRGGHYVAFVRPLDYDRLVAVQEEENEEEEGEEGMEKEGEEETEAACLAASSSWETVLPHVVLRGSAGGSQQAPGPASVRKRWRDPEEWDGRPPRLDEWYMISDSITRKCTVHDALGAQAYLLFYERE